MFSCIAALEALLTVVSSRFVVPLDDGSLFPLSPLRTPSKSRRPMIFGAGNHDRARPARLPPSLASRAFARPSLTGRARRVRSSSSSSSTSRALTHSRVASSRPRVLARATSPRAHLLVSATLLRDVALRALGLKNLRACAWMIKRVSIARSSVSRSRARRRRVARRRGRHRRRSSCSTSRPSPSRRRRASRAVRLDRARWIRHARAYPWRRYRPEPR